MDFNKQSELHNFCQYWLQRNKENEKKSSAYEKSDTQKFWLDLIEKVFGLSSYNFDLEFEKPVNMRYEGGGRA